MGRRAPNSRYFFSSLATTQVYLHVDDTKPADIFGDALSGQEKLSEGRTPGAEHPGRASDAGLIFALLARLAMGVKQRVAKRSDRRTSLLSPKEFAKKSHKHSPKAMRKLK